MGEADVTAKDPNTANTNSMLENAEAINATDLVAAIAELTEAETSKLRAVF